MQLAMNIPDGDIPWEYELLFCGEVGAHNPYVYHIISEILLQNRVESIIEFGPYMGALSCYLGLWGARLDVPVATFDIHSELADPLEDVLSKLDVTRYNMDVLSPVTQTLVMDIIDGRPTYLICDGGNKTAEFNRYAPLLPNRSVISIHDWGTEVNPEEVEDVAIPMLQFKPDHWVYHDAKFATYI